MKILFVAGALLLAAGAALITGGKKDEAAAPAGTEAPAEEMIETTIVRARIKRVKHDMNPVTLRGWTRLICECEDGQERTMSFDGETGVHLTDGEWGMLEHRNGVFVSFEKDSGEIVAPLYYVPAEDEEE